MAPEVQAGVDQPMVVQPMQVEIAVDGEPLQIPVNFGNCCCEICPTRRCIPMMEAASACIVAIMGFVGLLRMIFGNAHPSFLIFAVISLFGGICCACCWSMCLFHTISNPVVKGETDTEPPEAGECALCKEDCECMWLCCNCCDTMCCHCCEGKLHQECGNHGGCCCCCLPCCCVPAKYPNYVPDCFNDMWCSCFGKKPAEACPKMQTMYCCNRKGNGYSLVMYIIWGVIITIIIEIFNMLTGEAMLLGGDGGQDDKRRMLTEMASGLFSN